MINRIDHVAIVVNDLQETIDFYTTVLKFELGRSLQFEDRELAYLVLGDPPAAKIELLRYDATDKSKTVPDDRTLMGLRHLAFNVSDITATYGYLKNNGVEMVDNPPFMKPNGPPIAFAKDPNGILLEFSEI